MFISRVKSKGQFYYYAYVYDRSSYSRLKTVYSFGKKEKALVQLSVWREQNKKIPSELINLGLKIEKIDQWRKKIEGF